MLMQMCWIYQNSAIDIKNMQFEVETDLSLAYFRFAHCAPKFEVQTNWSIACYRFASMWRTKGMRWQRSMSCLIWRSKSSSGRTARILWVSITRALFYYCDTMLWQEFYPMGVQPSLKAALPLAERIGTASDCCNKTGPRVALHQNNVLVSPCIASEECTCFCLYCKTIFPDAGIPIIKII